MADINVFQISMSTDNHCLGFVIVLVDIFR